MQILELLKDISEKKLISYGRAELTKRDFIRLVDPIYGEIKNTTELGTDNFIVAREEDPVRFYALVFALWKNGNKVVFPNRDYFADSGSFDFHEYAVALKGDKIVVERNTAFNPVDLPGGGDTVVFSSGSTGVPKGILHDRNHFLLNAISVNQRIGYREYASVTPLKPYLVSAFNHFLVHFLSDSHLIFIDYENISKIGEYYETRPDTALVGSPMQVLSSVNFIDAENKPLFFFSSGDFMYSNNIAKIMEKFPGSVFFNVYGLAEIAGRFFMNRIDGETDPAWYNSVGENIDGTGCEVTDGQIYVRSRSHFFGYIKQGHFIASETKYPSGDLVRQDGDIMSLSGRVDDEIKIGGNKVSLKYIEKGISDVFKDDICVVFDIKHPRLGTLFALGLHTKNRYDRTELIKRLKTRLKPFEIPHKFYYIQKIPYTQTMKIDRNALKQDTENLTPII